MPKAKTSRTPSSVRARPTQATPSLDIGYSSNSWKQRLREYFERYRPELMRGLEKDGRVGIFFHNVEADAQAILAKHEGKIPLGEEWQWIWGLRPAYWPPDWRETYLPAGLAIRDLLADPSKVEWNKEQKALKTWMESGRLTLPPEPPEEIQSLGLAPELGVQWRACQRGLSERGVDIDRLIAILAGEESDQPLNLFNLVLDVRLRSFFANLQKKQRGELLSLLRHYQMLSRLLAQQDTPQENVGLLARDVRDIEGYINELLAREVPSLRDPKVGITVNPTRDISRQGFWTKPIVALVDYLCPILGSRRKAYQAVALVLSACFPCPGRPELAYPKDPDLVRHRYLDHRRRSLRR